MASANLELNSTSYSGYFTQGDSGGNITADNYKGDSASFYQTAAGFINDLLFQGIHNFWFQVAEVTGLIPTLSISQPQNETYITALNLPLNFTALNALDIRYNLDLVGNTTISGNTTFNTTNAQHTLYLFANNTFGSTSASRTFTVNTSKFFIHYSNYSGATRGSSTDFNQSTYEDLQNLSGIILENTNYGKIMFNEAINLTNDSIPADNILNLDMNTNISQNLIDINTTAIPNFNKSATLYLYNLTFSDPRILRDGAICSPSICTEVDYTGGTLIFNVTQFTSYSAEETPGTIPPGGGGGAGGAQVIFTIDKSQISIKLSPGQVKTENITITNTGKSQISIQINNTIPDFVVRSEAAIVLGPGESETVPVYVIARVDTVPDLYLGKLIVSSGSVKKEVLISVEVESKGVLLDVSTEILNNKKQVLPDQQLIAEIKLFNLGGEGRKDIDLEYLIKDYNGHEFVNTTESLAIETQINFIRRINLPQEIPQGQYIFYVRATYEGKIASASDNFEIVTSIMTAQEKLYIVIIIILSVVIGLAIYYIIAKRGAKKRVERISLNKIIR